MGDDTDCFCYSEKDAAILTESNHALTVLYLRNQMIPGSVKTDVKLKLLVFSLLRKLHFAPPYHSELQTDEKRQNLRDKNYSIK